MSTFAVGDFRISVEAGTLSVETIDSRSGKWQTVHCQQLPSCVVPSPFVHGSPAEIADALQHVPWPLITEEIRRRLANADAT